ncbi:MAG: CRTAC1 family protein [Pseudonocardiaceae bacterium]
MRLKALLRRNWPRLVAIACCLLVWDLARQPVASPAERAALAAPFHFTPYPVSSPDRPGERRLRPMAPAYRKINSWISSVGASTALFAVDGGTVSHDICLVDPRSDTVTIEPAPTTGQRYQPFTLKPTDLWYPSYAAPMGCLPVDLNEDGWQDVVVYYWGRSPVLFLRVPGVPPSPAAFKERELVSPPQVWNTNAATIGDFDGSGHQDLVFGNYFPDGARVLDPTAHQPELVMTNSLSNGNVNGGSTRLYRFVSATEGQDPDVRFAEVPDAFGPAESHEWTLALGAQDLDGSGRPDLYIANDFGPDHLLMNSSTPGHFSFHEVKGVRHFTTPKSKVVGNDSFKGMGVAFADLDNNSSPTILVSNITEPYALQESNFAFVYTGDRSAFRRGVAPYDDHSEELGLSRSGWSWDVKAADFDNSGAPQVMQATGFVTGMTNRWPQLQEAAMSNDLILAHPALWPHVIAGDDLSGHDHNTFFVRGPDGRYVDVADAIGVGTEAVSRSFAVGDVDGDGRLDFVVANQWDQSTFYKNGSRTGSFLGLRLRLPAGNALCTVAATGPTRPAIGASATLTRPDGTRTTQQVYPANGHNGVNAPDLHFGLGASHVTTVPVNISWRDGCGQLHATAVTFPPGWHDVILEPNGTTRGML